MLLYCGGLDMEVGAESDLQCQEVRISALPGSAVCMLRKWRSGWNAWKEQVFSEVFVLVYSSKAKEFVHHCKNPCVLLSALWTLVFVPIIS